MKFLFIHQNYPGQFQHLAPALVRLGHPVVALCVHPPRTALHGVRVVLHRPQFRADAVGADAPPMLHELYAKLVRGESARAAMAALASDGFVPDVVYAHPGWGEALHVKQLFPRARLVIYAEYYYGGAGGDIGFDPEFSAGAAAAMQAASIKNTHLLHALNDADAIVSPTAFQRSRHPAWSQPRIEVIHDGIDSGRFRPDPDAAITLGPPSGLSLSRSDEVVTFVARQLEPHRGYHIFMRALPALLRLRPNAHIVIVGGDGVAYGARAPSGQTWKQIFRDEMGAQPHGQRVHFVGSLEHATLTRLLQVSSAHVYLSYPFVASWSLLEAMSIGCLVIGSRTAPVEEIITHGGKRPAGRLFRPRGAGRDRRVGPAAGRRAGPAARGRAPQRANALRPGNCLPARPVAPRTGGRHWESLTVALHAAAWTTSYSL